MACGASDEDNGDGDYGHCGEEEHSEIILEIKNHFDAADAHGGEDGGDDNDEKAAAGEVPRW